MSAFSLNAMTGIITSNRDISSAAQAARIITNGRNSTSRLTFAPFEDTQYTPPQSFFPRQSSIDAASRTISNSVPNLLFEAAIRADNLTKALQANSIDDETSLAENISSTIFAGVGKDPQILIFSAIDTRTQATSNNLQVKESATSARNSSSDVRPIRSKRGRFLLLGAGQGGIINSNGGVSGIGSANRARGNRLDIKT